MFEGFFFGGGEVMVPVGAVFVFSLQLHLYLSISFFFPAALVIKRNKTWPGSGIRVSIFAPVSPADGTKHGTMASDCVESSRVFTGHKKRPSLKRRRVLVVIGHVHAFCFGDKIDTMVIARLCRARKLLSH